MEAATTLLGQVVMATHLREGTADLRTGEEATIVPTEEGEGGMEDEGGVAGTGNEGAVVEDRDSMTSRNQIQVSTVGFVWCVRMPVHDGG